MQSLVTLRKEFGLSQRQMADILEISASQLSLCELGQRKLPHRASVLVARLSLAAKSLASPSEEESLPLSQKEMEKWVLECRSVKVLLENLGWKMETLQKQRKKVVAITKGESLLNQNQIWQEAETGRDHWQLLIRKARAKQKKIEKEILVIGLKMTENQARLDFLKKQFPGLE